MNRTCSYGAFQEGQIIVPKRLALWRTAIPPLRPAVCWHNGVQIAQRWASILTVMIFLVHSPEAIYAQTPVNPDSEILNEDVPASKAYFHGNASHRIRPGKVVKRVVYDSGYRSDNCLLRFDTGTLISPGHIVAEYEGFEWIAKHQGDVVGRTNGTVKGLMGCDMVALPVDAEEWNNLTFEDASARLQGMIPTTPSAMIGRGDLPATYLFKCRTGTIGLLQILGFDDAELAQAVFIRYKLLGNASRDVTEVDWGTLQWGPVTQAWLSPDRDDEANSRMDLENRKIYSSSSVPRHHEQTRRLETSIDLVGAGHTPTHGLHGINLIAIPFHAGLWDAATPFNLRRLRHGKSGSPVPLSGRDGLPSAYLFKTSDGSMGMLRILKVDDEGKVFFQYKMAVTVPPIIRMLESRIVNEWTCTHLQDSDVSAFPPGLRQPHFEVAITRRIDSSRGDSKPSDATHARPALRLFFYPQAMKREILKAIEQVRLQSGDIPIYFGETADFVVVTSPAYINGGDFSPQGRAAIRPVWSLLRAMIPNQENTNIDELVADQ